MHKLFDEHPGAKKKMFYFLPKDFFILELRKSILNCYFKI